MDETAVRATLRNHLRDFLWPFLWRFFPRFAIVCISLLSTHGLLLVAAFVTAFVAHLLGLAPVKNPHAFRLFALGRKVRNSRRAFRRSALTHRQLLLSFILTTHRSLTYSAEHLRQSRRSSRPNLVNFLRLRLLHPNSAQSCTTSRVAPRCFAAR